MMIAGIDTGLGGAIAIMGEDMAVHETIDMPSINKEVDGQALKKFFKECLVDDVVIEKAQSMPGQGVVSVGSYMAGYGYLKGLCAGLEIPYTLIHPATWKKVMLGGMPKEKELRKRKAQSLIKVRQLYPGLDLPRVKDHNKADAILIARWYLVKGRI